MNVVFQVVFEESPEARKFSKDLRALVFCAAKNVLNIAKRAPEWTGKFRYGATLETKRIKIITPKNQLFEPSHRAQTPIN
jgi:hypothetical protein